MFRLLTAGRTRTCNQTVMSGRIQLSFVDLLHFHQRSSAFVALLARSFLVRNWCGARAVVGLDELRQ